MPPLFQLLKVSWTPFHQLFKRPHWDKNFSWQLWRSIRLLTDEAKCSWQNFLINNFLSSTWNLLCVTKVVNQKLWKNCCRQKKKIDLFSLFRRENSSMRLVIYHFLIDNTKYEFVAMFQNSHWSQKVADRKESSTWNSCQQHLVLRVYSLKFVIAVAYIYYIYMHTHLFDKKLRSSLNTESFLIFLLFSPLHFYCNQVLYFYCSQVESWVH